MAEEEKLDRAWRLLQEQYLARADSTGQTIGAGMGRPAYRLELLNDPAFGCAIRAIDKALDT